MYSWEVTGNGCSIWVLVPHGGDPEEVPGFSFAQPHPLTLGEPADGDFSVVYRPFKQINTSDLNTGITLSLVAGEMKAPVVPSALLLRYPTTNKPRDLRKQLPMNISTAEPSRPAGSGWGTSASSYIAS